MYKVIIVEDDLLVRMGIKSSVDWSKYSMEVVSDVCNGQLAWDFYQKSQADLIITDIKMPLMNGIQLIEKIRAKDSKCKIVILTCVEEFESARKATSLNVSEYILKLTMTPQELENVIAKVKKELDESSQQSASNLATELPFEKILYNYIYYKQYSEKTIRKLISKRKIEFFANIIACIMEVDQYQLLKKTFEDENGSLTTFALLNIMSELLEPVSGTILFHEQEGRYILLFSYNTINNEQSIYSGIRNTLIHLQKTLALYFNVTVSFAVSEVGHGFNTIYHMISTSSKVLEYKYFIGKGAILFCSKIDLATIHVPIFDNIQQQLETNDLPRTLKQELYRSIQIYHSERALHKDDVYNRILSLYQLVCRYDKTTEKSNYIELADFMKMIYKSEFYQDTVDIFFTRIQKLPLGLTHPKSFGKEINQVILFLNKNYQKPFSLKEISELVGYSPNYLSSFFKSELSITLVEYLNQIRIEKAKTLLMQTNLKSYEIAAEVGFKDESYFSRTFKKITGMRPNEYKRNQS